MVYKLLPSRKRDGIRIAEETDRQSTMGAPVLRNSPCMQLRSSTIRTPEQRSNTPLEQQHTRLFHVKTASRPGIARVCQRIYQETVSIISGDHTICFGDASSSKAFLNQTRSHADLTNNWNFDSLSPTPGRQPILPPCDSNQLAHVAVRPNVTEKRFSFA